MPEQQAAPVAQAPAAAPAAPAPAASEATAPAQNTAEQAPAATPEGEKPETKTDQDPEKQRGQRRFERRLDRAYRRAAEAEAKAALLEKQLAEYKPAAAPTDPSAPKLEDFKDIEAYAEAKAKHASDKALTAHTTKQSEAAQKQAQARLTEQWTEKTDRAEDKYDDWQEVVGDLQPSTPWAVAIMEAENGDDIAYHLGKNLKEAQRIASLPPVSQIREIGRLEAKLLAEPPAKPKEPSKAPAPVKTLSGTGDVKTDVPSEQDDMRTWMRKRQKQVHGSSRR